MQFVDNQSINKRYFDNEKLFLCHI